MQMIAWISLIVAFVCALVIAADEVRRPQKMMVMNIVWPVTALYLSVFALWAYFTIGVTKSNPAMQMNGGSGKRDDCESPPTLAQTAVAATHCGAVVCWAMLPSNS